MSEFVSVTEAALLARDQPKQPWQQVFVLLLAGGLSRAELIARIGERICYAPRFRRRVEGWPIAAWVDDPTFHVAGHVREQRLPADQSLEQWLADLLNEPLDAEHPLWQAVLLDEVAPGRQALIVRCHPALVDGYDHVHLLQELLDDQPTAEVGPEPSYQPQPAPGLDTALAGLRDPLQAAGEVVGGLFGLVENTVRSVSVAERAQHLAVAEVELAALKVVRNGFACTVHDVVLALVTAGLRGQALRRARAGSDPVALVPLAISEPAVLESAIGCRIAPSWLSLPVSEPSAAERLSAIATMTRVRADSGQCVRVPELVELAGFAPPTLHAVTVGSVGAGRAHQVLVADVPGPQRACYLGTALVEEVFGFASTTDAEEVSVGVTSYRGRLSLAAVSRHSLDGWADDLAAELTILLKEAR